MGRRLFTLSIGTAVALGATQIAACGLESAGTAGAADATTDVVADTHVLDVVPSDATDSAPDTAPVDAGQDGDASEGGPNCDLLGQFYCGTKCVTSCAACGLGTAQCNSTRQCGDCTTCADGKFACYNCSTSPVIGICQAAKCAGGNECACAGGDAGSCPGATQICTGGGMPKCQTCGVGGTDNKQCANGKQCNEMMAACQ